KLSNIQENWRTNSKLKLKHRTTYQTLNYPKFATLTINSKFFLVSSSIFIKSKNK
ncbi:hypothetical protein Leryth_008412, partial [Lithospermum erythrorhizon]